MSSSSSSRSEQSDGNESSALSESLPLEGDSRLDFDILSDEPRVSPPTEHHQFEDAQNSSGPEEATTTKHYANHPDFTKDQYRRHTRWERGVADALDALEAEDLSLQLYRIHALKQSRYNLARGENPESSSVSYERKSRWIDEADASTPRKQWTAWPLKPGEVPGAGERFLGIKDDSPREVDALGLENRRGWFRLLMKPSEPLEECLIATVTKRAREMFERHQYEEEDEEVRLGSNKTVGSSVLDSQLSTTMNRSASAPATAEKQTANAPGEQFVMGKKDDSSSDAASEDMDQLHGFTSNYENDDEDTDSDIPQQGTVQERPVTTLLDDDKARKLLLPSVRHILSSLDEVLLALDRTRRRQLDATESDSESGSSNSGSTPSQPRGRPSSRRSKSKSIGPKSRSTSNATRTKSRSSSRDSSPLPVRERRLGLRDWSEVLGNASLMGWDATAIAKTHKRCKELFGETMTFQILEETNIAKQQTDEGEQVSTNANEKYEGGVRVDGFLRPMPAPRFGRGKDKQKRRRVTKKVAAQGTVKTEPATSAEE